MWLAVILFCAILALFFYYDTKKPPNFPPGPTWWPILGSCLELQKVRKQTGTLQEATAMLSKKYGPVIGLKVGKDLSVVVCSHKHIKKFLTEDNFNGRPHGIFYRYRTWGYRRGLLLTDREFWHEQRKFVLRHLKEFGFGQRNMSALIEEEVLTIVDTLEKKIKSQKSGAIVRMDDFFGIHVINTLWTMMAGTRYNPNDVKLKSLQKLLTILFTKIDIIGAMFSHFPFLRFVAPEYSGYNIYMDTHRRIWDFLDSEMEKHKQTFSPDNPRDFMDIYLKALMSPTKKDSFSEKQLMAICLDLFIAGSETTNKTLGFAFIHLVLNPQVQTKCQEEIDRVIGRDRLPTLNDRSQLQYVEATVLEALRHFGGRAFAVPHRALEDTYLDGYLIPKDTTILANLRILLSEESGFEEPEAFKPERFIKDGRIELPDNYIPFGYGKHRCLGETLAKANIFLIIAGLLQRFNFSVAPGHPPPSTESVDGVTPGPQPFSVLVTARLDNNNNKLPAV
ncbi:probable cytochrome P450 303a1 [Agrilus planipennis]|uniref:Probable cytochrome P450 303a1 n=1 Tax=Agrilus planipennis TaxID=224129 RepID=A0A1W4WY09_AGRPL|nr:probable cytochrome P450 303a1 [Agrilus planipennis]XP_025837700.1 probable cytochrome P450 303a1 [Agrilus planipennis]